MPTHVWFLTNAEMSKPTMFSFGTYNKLLHVESLQQAKHLLTRTRLSTEKARQLTNQLLTRADELSQEESERAISLSRIVILLGKQLSDTEIQARGWFKRGYVELYQAKHYSQAVHSYENALDALAEQSLDSEMPKRTLLSTVYYHLANAYEKQHLYDEALWALKKSLEYIEATQQPEQVEGVRKVISGIERNKRQSQAENESLLNRLTEAELRLVETQGALADSNNRIGRLKIERDQARRDLITTNKIANEQAKQIEEIKTECRGLEQRLVEAQEQLRPYPQATPKRKPQDDLEDRRQPSQTLIFCRPVQRTPEGIAYYREYHPKTMKGSENPVFDAYSMKVLHLKEHDSESIEYFSEKVEEILAPNIAIAVVPSSSADTLASGICLVARRLSRKNRVDATSCLVRHTNKKSAHSGGDRSIEGHLRTIRVDNKHLIAEKLVLILDDITTTGNSFLACKRLLLEAGASEVECFALGRTVR